MSFDLPSMQIIGVRTPLIKPGDDIVNMLCGSLNENEIFLRDGDVLVLAESAVATAEGRMVDLSTVIPSKEAEELAGKYCVDSREMELVLCECDDIIGGVPGAALTITKGTLSPNAGIDGSNAPEGHVVLLPENAQKSAAKIRAGMEEFCCCHLGVIIGDSRTQPLRLGCVGMALGTSGIVPVEDARGSKDLFGKPLNITRKAVADNLVSAAQLLMGEADECIPCVLIRGAPVKMVKGSQEMPIFTPEECMYYSNIKQK
ncbi:coenzyme F420-0:L-glutamate ligase [Methanococcoides methylutens]|nr:coenzyme F420-0:L-glutamate ligase [Methanococcoides methylutens]